MTEIEKEKPIYRKLDMKKNIFLLILLHLTFVAAFSQVNYGLRFKSKEVITKNRTGLDITSNGPISYQNSFKIQFDISFRNYRDFGYIFRLKELNSGNQIDLLCKLDEASPGFYLVLNKKETEAKIKLNNLIRQPTNEWNKLEAEFNSKTGLIQLCFGGEKISEKIKFPSNSEFVLAFGVVNNYDFETKEVPYISMKDLSIDIDGNPKYCWPLNSHNGSLIIDTINNKQATILNPEWEIYHHSKWKYFNGIKLAEKAQITYDKEKEIVWLVCENNKMYYLDLNTNRFDSIIYKGLPPVYEDDNQIIVTNNSKIVTYSHQDNRTSTFDNEGAKWNPEFTKHDSLPKYWHHNKLINPLDNKIVTLCGYGFYTYKNDIMFFNDSIEEWINLKFDGDTIFPRYLSALGQNPKNREQFYLFGGLGNKSGDQVLGTQFYYDLYLIDFKKKVIRRIWDLNFKNEFDITPVNSLIVDNKSDCFYTLCFPHNDERTYLQVLKASLTKPEYALIGDSIPYFFSDIQSYADLFYWNSTNKLVAITSSKSGNSKNDIKIYTLQFPPGSLNVIKGIEQKTSWIDQKIIIPFFALVVFISLIIIYIRKRKNNHTKNNDAHKAISDPLMEGIKTRTAEASSINLFGGFQVIDKRGKDITYRFSPTLKELFLLMFLYSFKGSKGISSNKLQEILWPDKSSSSAKNNRGVNIKKLRSVLPDIGEIEIIYESPYWRLALANNIFCDYLYVSEVINNQSPINFDDNTLLRKLLSYLKRGNMLANIETEWLDKFKGEISTKIVQFLELHLQNSDIKSHSNIIIEIANVIALFDQLNETALCYKCKVLNSLGEHSLALSAYNNYTKLYLHVYSEEYTIAFKQLIKI